MRYKVRWKLSKHKSHTTLYRYSTDEISASHNQAISLLHTLNDILLAEAVALTMIDEYPLIHQFIKYHDKEYNIIKGKQEEL